MFAGWCLNTSVSDKTDLIFIIDPFYIDHHPDHFRLPASRGHRHIHPIPSVCYRDRRSVLAAGVPDLMEAGVIQVTDRLRLLSPDQILDTVLAVKRAA